MIANRHVLLVTLTLASAIAVVDRQLMTILQEPIRRELGLSDTQLGLLTGFAFSLFYAAFGIPMGRLADRANRRDLIAGALAAWSAMTALTGFATGFVHLLLARIGVAVGEAGVTPTATSIISDAYPPHRLAFANAVYTNGYQIGLLIGFLAGGLLESLVGWRGAFILAGLPGLVLAVVLRTAFADPPRATTGTRDTMTLGQGLRALASSATLRWLAAAAVLNAAGAYTLMSWSAPFLVRIHGFSLIQAATWLALGFGIGGFIGNLAVGAAVDRLVQRDPRWYLWMPAAISLAMLPFLIASLYLEGALVIAVLLVPFCLIVAHSSICITLLNRLTPPSFRATTIAVYILMTNVLGMGVGTTMVGVLSDALRPRYGDGLGMGLMLIVIPACALAIGPYLLAARTVSSDLEDRV